MYRVRIVLFVVALLPVLVSLGFWQLGRYHSKLDLEQQYQSRRNGEFSITDLKDVADPRYFQLFISGQFDNSREFLLDNRTYKGQVGFHVLTPFVTSSGEFVLIDRGWIAGVPDRSRFPDVPEVTGMVTITGQSWLPAGEAFLLTEDFWEDGWPKVIQALDSSRMEEVLEVTVQPWLLILDSNQPGSLQRNFYLTNMPASRHFGYAVQWFAMAIALVILGLWALLKDKNKSKAVERGESI